MCFTNIRALESTFVQYQSAASSLSPAPSSSLPPATSSSNPARLGSRIQTHFYSLTNPQKAIATTLLVISLIAVIIGSIYLNKASWAMPTLATGAAAGGLTVVVVSAKHIHLKHRVNNEILRDFTSNPNDWLNVKNYRDPNICQEPGTFNVDGDGIYAHRRVENNSGLESLHVDFYSYTIPSRTR